MFIYLLIAVFLTLFSPAWAVESTGWGADVVGVKDGDTIVVKRDKALEAIRLSGVVCPKHDRRFGQEAVKATASLCLGKTVVVEPQSFDREGHIIGNVLMMDDSSLNSQLISLGFGCCPTNDLRFQDLEANARSEQLGFWGRKDFAPAVDWPREQNTIGKLEPSTRAN